MLDYLHLRKDVLNLLDVQQIAAVFVSVDKGHHGFSLERVELIEPVEVKFGLAGE